MTGFSLMIVGGLIDWIERKGLELPPFLKWSLLALTIIGCCMVPSSGFWLLLIPSIGMYVHTYKWTAKKATPAA
jgi:hypothetical protein